MASIVICMELRRLFYDLKKRIKRHTNYLRVIEKMEKRFCFLKFFFRRKFIFFYLMFRFPWANKDELDEPDKCAVCWDKLDKARKLPCSHMFHQ
jgi:autocrine motility factor receptor